MAFQAETTATKSGTPIDLEVHKSPTGISGVVAHWGERIQAYDLRQIIQEAHPGKELAKDTGFTSIYHQRNGISRREAIADELEIATLVANETLTANAWEPETIYGLFVGSGVPVADDPKYPDYAAEISRRIGLPKETFHHTTHAACNSGGHEIFNALKNPEMQGKRVLLLGIEGVTALTPDFDPERADHLSMQVFSNGAAGIAFVPGNDITLLHHRREVFPDSNGALAAHMTYGKLLKSTGGIWQESDKVSMMIMPEPEDEMLLRMRGVQTTSLFVKQGARFINKVYQDYDTAHPNSPPKYAVAHHASKGVNTILQNRLRSAGLDLEFPWVVNDGNSSAATTMTAQNRTLERANDGTRVLFISYGAGASFDGGVIEYHERGNN